MGTIPIGSNNWVTIDGNTAVATVADIAAIVVSGDASVATAKGEAVAGDADTLAAAAVDAQNRVNIAKAEAGDYSDFRDDIIRTEAITQAGVYTDQETAKERVRLTQVESTNTNQGSTLNNHDIRLEAVEALGGLAPGSLSDATMASIAASAGTQFATELTSQIVGSLPVVVTNEPTGGTDTAMLNAVLAANAGKMVQLRAGRTYIINDQLNVPSGTTFDLNGSTIDATSIPAATALGQRTAFRTEGSLNSALPISAALAQGSRTVTGISSTTTLSPGDLVLMANDESPVPGMTRSDRDKGELNVIKSVDSGTQATLFIGSLFAYGNTGFNLRKVNPTKDVRVSDGEVLLGGVGSGHCGLQARYGRNIYFENMRVDGAEDTAVNFRTVWNGQVRGGNIENSTSSATLGTTGYGVSIVEGSRFCDAERVEFKNCRHFITGGGFWPASNIDINDCFGIGSLNAAYDTHESCFYWRLRKNKALACAAGFGMRGQFIEVDDNYVFDSPGLGYSARTFDGVTEQRGISFRRNTAVRCAGGGIAFEGMAIGAEPNCLKIDGEATDNIITDCGTPTVDGVVLRHFDGMRAWGNTILRSGRNGINIIGLVGTPSKNLQIGPQRILDSGRHGIEIANVDDGAVSGAGGEIRGTVNSGMNITNCNRFNYTTPTIRNPGQAGVNIVGGSGHCFSNPSISGGLNAGYDAIRVSGSGDFSVIGGNLGSSRHAVYSTATENVILQGVNMRGAASGPRFIVEAVNKAVSGNLI
ncbi:hypothetical protein [Arthrobacter sp. 260]|uniref:hypothetical protein n=1 Tax=Arthrobacter sp. 260 TaxID=2735314 RepID=UPI0014919FEB|nr:hypothetical protein [Arthrobacter sp. 260]NOJ59765.1 hypothetical protein [Arthrobacter sp. 260]